MAFNFREGITFRFVPDTHPKRAGLFQMQSRHSRGDWRPVSAGLSNAEVEEQIAMARNDGYKVEDYRAGAPVVTARRRHRVKK